MFRTGKIKNWKRNVLPDRSKAKSQYCLSNHFHRSGLEARVCDELRLRKIAGDIKDYRREVTLHLELDRCKLGTYRIDFIVEENDGTIEYLEAKGLAFAKWERDWKILQHMHRNDKMAKFRVVTD